MAMSLGSDGASKRKRLEIDLNSKPVDDLNKSDSPVDVNNSDTPDEEDPCPVCFEPLVKNASNPRALVTLNCSHKFHLDCIGSAFNAKGFMECPSCKQIEPGEWRYARGHVEDEDLFADEEEDIVPGLDDSLSQTFRWEFCPFECLRGPFDVPPPFVMRTNEHGMGGQCSFEEILVPIAPYSSLRSPFAGQLPNSTRRMFWSYHEPGVMRGRHYFAHPNFDHSFYGRSDNSMVNAPMTVRDHPRYSSLPNALFGGSVVNVPMTLRDHPLHSSLANVLYGGSVVNAPMTLHDHPHYNLLANSLYGGSSHVIGNGFFANPSYSYGGSSHVIDNGLFANPSYSYGGLSHVNNNNGFNRLNVWQRLPTLEELSQQHETGSQFYRMINGGDGGGNNERSSTTISGSDRGNAGGSGSHNPAGSSGGNAGGSGSGGGNAGGSGTHNSGGSSGGNAGGSGSGGGNAGGSGTHNSGGSGGAGNGNDNGISDGGRSRS